MMWDVRSSKGFLFDLNRQTSSQNKGKFEWPVVVHTEFFLEPSQKKYPYL